MSKNQKLFISFILIILAVLCRILPHAWNFAPVAAIALFAGVYLGRNYAIALPVTSMFLGDIFLGFYDWKLMLVVYICFVICGLMGLLIKKYKSAETILAGSIFASFIFFLATNWAVWQFSPWYAKTWAGLIECYTLALPFFRNTLLGDLFYVGVLFGAYEFVLFLVKKKQLNNAVINN